MRNKALVVGSVSFDVIFAIHGNIKDELPFKDGKLSSINLMFTAKNKEVYHGGTAGNIAYGLGLQGQKPLMYSVVGDDFNGDYSKRLEDVGVDIRTVNAGKKGFTSNFYGISDEHYQQIGIWQPNSYGEMIEQSKLSETLEESDFKKVKYAIFSPGTGISTRNHMLEVNKKTAGEAKLIFDPSQVLSIFYDDVLLKECLSLADIVIGNDVEIAQFETIFKYSIKDIIGQGVEYVIETLGEKGVNVHNENGKKFIKSVKPERVVETTGAGDAFRAGLMHGLMQDEPIEKCCEYGTMLGSKSVEEFGGQGYVL